ncbi:MAG TPA: PAS domain-containing protein, partial [Trichocoleus sp.]
MTGQDGNRSRGGFRVNALFLFVGLLALIAAHGLALLFRIAPAISLWFPPSGVAIALTFWLGPIGAGLTGLAAVIMAPAWGSQGWLRLVGLTDAVEPLLAWLLYCRFFGGSLNLGGLPQVIAFLLSAPLAACAVSALLGCSVLSLLGNLTTVDLGTTIAHWWLGNALGTLTLAPLALLLLIPRLPRRGQHSPPTPESDVSDWLPLRRHWLETLVILISAVGSSFLTVKATETSVFVTLQLSLLGLVPLVWAAIRFGLPGAVLALSFRVSTALLAYLVVYPNAMTLPSFPVAPELLHTHKLSLLLQSAIALLVGAAISERTAVQVALTAEQIRRSEYQTRAEMGEQLFQLNRQLHETNAHLQQTESVLNAFLTSSPVGLALLDPDLRYLYANEALANISGAPLDQHLGRSLADVAPPLAARLGPVLQAVLASRQPILNLEFDDGLNGASASPLHRHALANAFPVNLPNGDVLGVGMTILDISELKRIEAALRQSELSFRTLADAVPQMFWITGPDGYHQYFNQRWYDYTGTTLEQTQGDGWQQVLHPDDVSLTQSIWQHCLQTGKHYEVEYRLRQAVDGTYRWHLGRALPLRSENNQIIQWFGSCTDIHDQ